MQPVEHLDGLLGGHLMAVNGQGGVNDLLHAQPDLAGVVERHGVPYVQVYVVSVAHGYVDGRLGRCIEVVHSLAQHEEQRAGVGAQSAVGGDVEKLYGLWLVQPVVHAFNLVIHSCADGAVAHSDARHRKHVFYGGSHGHIVFLAVVDTVYLNGFLHNILVLGLVAAKLRIFFGFRFVNPNKFNKFAT